MIKKLVRLPFLPFTLTARMVATFGVWLMEDDARLIETWKEMEP